MIHSGLEVLVTPSIALASLLPVLRLNAAVILGNNQNSSTYVERTYVLQRGPVTFHGVGGHFIGN